MTIYLTVMNTQGHKWSMSLKKSNITINYILIISNLWILPFFSLRDIVSINRLILMLQIISHCDIKHILTNKNNSISCEGRDTL